jgi:glucose-6-phosphate isomerase
VQIPAKSQDKFIKSMTEKTEKIRSLFLEHAVNLTKNIAVKVMLGDATVSEQHSFDPALIRQFYGDLLKKLPNWKAQGISASNEKDLRRIFIRFEAREGNYLLSGYLSLQYHALLFYKLNHRVIDIQKELAEITDKINELQTNLAPKGDQLIHEKLKELGYDTVDQQKLFEIFFQNDNLVKEMIEQVYSNTDENFAQLTKRRSDLFKDLDDLLIEIYHTTPVMIDETRMIAAEEGCLCKFDLEHLKNDDKEGNFDPARISLKIKEKLLKKMDEVLDAIKI